jgi:hypothetical protein
MNKGGRPKGSSIAYQRAEKLREKEATSHVCIEYAAAKDEAMANGKKVRDGLLKELVEDTKKRYSIKDPKFDVHRSTIQSRIKAGNLEVWSSGPLSLVLPMEVVLCALIISAWECNYPLTVGECFQVANNLVEGTELAAEIIKWKQKHKCYDPDGLLLDWGWWRGFRKRNAEVVESKVGRKFACLRAAHCTYSALVKMYDNFEHGLVASGNAVKLANPYLVNIRGEVVTDEADAFGRAVTIRHTRPNNVVVGDETGSSTREMGDGNNGGERCMTAVGETPRYEASSKHSHFTVVPFTRLTGELVMVAIIFSGAKMKPDWAIGKDIFAEWIGEDDDFASNVGPGKYFPMGPSCKVDGKDIPCYCDCSPNGSMTSSILRRILSKMDELGVVSRGVNEDGTEFYPVIILDGHISRMGLEFLKYINDKAHRWRGMLVCPYGTSKTQFHDHEKENATFKCRLFEAKRLRVRKRREHGLPADLTVDEVPIIVKEASDASYANIDFAQETFRLLGYLPFTRAVLDDPEILSTAPPEVQAERGRILKLRRDRQGISVTSRALRVAPNQIDLSTIGSGRLMGGSAAIHQIESMAAGLNTTGATAGSLLTLLHQAKETREGRRGNNEELNRGITRDKMLERFRKARQFTAGVVYFSGKGELDADVLVEVQRRFDNRKANSSKIEAKKKKRLKELQSRVAAIKQRMKAKRFKLTSLKVPELKDYCKWKKQSGDDPLPTKKADLIRLLKKTKGRASPQVSSTSKVFSHTQDYLSHIRFSSQVSPYNSDASSIEDDLESFNSDESAPSDNDLEFNDSDASSDEEGDDENEASDCESG